MRQSFIGAGLVLLVLLFSCNSTPPAQKTSPTPEGTTTQPAADTLVILDSLYAPDSTAAVLPEAAIINETVSAQLLPVIKLRKTITSPTQAIHFTITDLEPGWIHISIEPTQPHTNIRISQILMPDNSTDGPFGQELDYEIRQRGDYTFIISRSNMASGSPEGDLYITAER
ncbi:hypothetical protein GCM10027051_20040 [Niabella terrae]